MTFTNDDIRKIPYGNIDGTADMVTEECAELITAIRHLARGKIQVDELYGELADVLIVVQNFILAIGAENEVEQKVSEKIARYFEKYGKKAN